MIYIIKIYLALVRLGCKKRRLNVCKENLPYRNDNKCPTCNSTPSTDAVSILELMWGTSSFPLLPNKLML